MEDKVTTFLSSHDAQEVRSLCSEISVIANGRVVYAGATGELGVDLDAFEERLIELVTQPDCAKGRFGPRAGRRDDA
jgi:ABC-2 type transport system ATP-binding protein